MSIKTLIIGGGPAGLAAAFFAPGPVVVLERMPAPGRKLLATGGGRCNLTHDADAAGIMAAFGPHSRFMAPALRAFPPQAIRTFFASLGIETLAEPDGCVFPVSQRAVDVVQALERAVRAKGAAIRCGVRATRLITEPDPLDPSVRHVAGADTSEGPIRAERVILAAGGQSYPRLGSDGSGFALARDAGLSVTPPVPALAGWVTRETWPYALAGIVLDAGGLRIDLPDAARAFQTGPVLFTHKGLSGIPALDLSGEIAARLLDAPEGQEAAVPVRLSCIASRPADAWLSLFNGWRATHGGRALHNLLSGELPRALAHTLCALAEVRDVAAARASKAMLRALAEACANQRLHVTGTEGWERAMATRGGVSLGELDPKTLACRRLRGLACAGEVVDLDGRCGGYNLTWAFASGRLAGLAAGA